MIGGSCLRLSISSARATCRAKCLSLKVKYSRETKGQSGQSNARKLSIGKLADGRRDPVVEYTGRLSNGRAPQRLPMVICRYKANEP